MQALLQQLQLVSEPSRFEILKILFSTDEDLCVNEIADMIGSSPSAVSHHFAKLELANLVRSYKNGRKVCYKILDNSATAKLAQIYQILLN